MSALDNILPLPLEQPVPWPDALPGKLSPTQLAMFARCPEQFRRRYVLREKERPGSALVWGSADHYAHEQNFTQKIESRRDISPSDLSLAFAEGFDVAVEKNGGAKEIMWGDDKPGDLKDAGVQVALTYHDQVSPSVQPVDVEREINLELPGVPVPVIGYVDVETDDVGIERKTAKSKPQRGEIPAKWIWQRIVYPLALGKPLAYHVATKTKTPAVYTPETDPGLLGKPLGSAARLIAAKARAISATYMEFGPEEPWPDALGHEWACQFCGWRPTCSWWQS
jgi:hypothetical protein